MNDTRITQAKELVADAQALVYALTSELAPNHDRRELLLVTDALIGARQRLAVLGECRHRSNDGPLCGLPAGHEGTHQRSFNGGRTKWTDTEGVPA